MLSQQSVVRVLVLNPNSSKDMTHGVEEAIRSIDLPKVRCQILQVMEWQWALFFICITSFIFVSFVLFFLKKKRKLKDFFVITFLSNKECGTILFRMQYSA